MTTPQLLTSALALVMLASAGCNRADTNENARDAAAEVRTAAAEAGDRLTDGWLVTKVQAQYFADEDIKARYINVSARDRVVTLTGYVESDAARQQAVQIAKNTDGVLQIDDKLLIGRAPDEAFDEDSSTPGAVPTSGSRTDNVAEDAVERIDDARVTTTIQAKYFLDTVVKGRRIDVDTSDGVVTLRGEVASEDERAQALLLARNTAGVQRVEDNLTVNATLGAQ